MHCQGCANSIAAKLSDVPGVASVKSDVQAKVTVVTPRPQTVLSPRALWEAVEKAGKQPAKLEGPSGTFTDKPKS
jgi:Cu+-exporting ATPase